MDAEREHLVAGLFESQRQADAVLEGLHRVGVADADVEIGAPEPGQYRIEHHESAEFWTAVRKGMMIGALIGSAVSLGIMRLAVPGLSLIELIELSVPMGAFWGVFVGGLSGVAAKAVSLAEGEPRHTIVPDSSDVLVVVHAGDRVGAAHEAMERRHPLHFLVDVPAVRHTPLHRGAAV